MSHGNHVKVYTDSWFGQWMLYLDDFIHSTHQFTLERLFKKNIKIYCILYAKFISSMIYVLKTNISKAKILEPWSLCNFQLFEWCIESLVETWCCCDSWCKRTFWWTRIFNQCDHSGHHWHWTNCHQCLDCCLVCCWSRLWPWPFSYRWVQCRTAWF